MERYELMDKIQEIQDKNYTLFKGVNEADLATREDIADLFERLIKECVMANSSNEDEAGLHLHCVNTCALCGSSDLFKFKLEHIKCRNCNAQFEHGC